MSSSETSQVNNNFKVTARKPNSTVVEMDAVIKVFNGHGRLCGEGEGRISLRLPKGLYTVRVERLGEMREEVLVHKSRTDRPINVPRRNSAIPMSDTKHAHEFLQLAATTYSRKSTWSQGKVDKSWRRMMIMIRADGNEKNTFRELARGLTLYHEAGSSITKFQQDRIKTEKPNTYVVYSARLPVGNYMLSLSASGRDELLPITLFQKWDTFVFVPYEGRPKLTLSSIVMAPQDQGYHSDNMLTKKIDAAMQGLGSRLELLPSHDRMSALHGKFEHPMLGLIGAHSHFLSGNRKEKLERQVLKNLWRLLRGSADVIALLLMSLDRDDGKLPTTKTELDEISKEAFGEKICNLLPLTFPPMFESGLNALVRGSQELNDLIAQNSWLETAANSTYGAGVWAIWNQPSTKIEVVSPESASSQKSGPPLSMQKLYPTVKRALANLSTVAAGEIFAGTELNQYIQPSKMNIKSVIAEVNNNVIDYVVPAVLPGAANLRTVRDLVRQVQMTAIPQTESGSEDLGDVENFKPSSRIETWLIDVVHDHIDKVGSDFDVSQLAKRYSVPKRSVERAAQMPRLPQIS